MRRDDVGADRPARAPSRSTTWIQRRAPAAANCAASSDGLAVRVDALVVALLEPDGALAEQIDGRNDFHLPDVSCYVC